MRIVVALAVVLIPSACLAQGAPQAEITYSPTLSVTSLQVMQDALGRQTCTVLDAANRRCGALNAYMEMDAQIGRQNNERAQAARDNVEKQLRERLAADAAKTPKEAPNGGGK